MQIYQKHVSSHHVAGHKNEKRKTDTNITLKINDSIHGNDFDFCCSRNPICTVKTWVNMLLSKSNYSIFDRNAEFYGSACVANLIKLVLITPKNLTFVTFAWWSFHWVRVILLIYSKFNYSYSIAIGIIQHGYYRNLNLEML